MKKKLEVLVFFLTRGLYIIKGTWCLYKPQNQIENKMDKTLEFLLLEKPLLPNEKILPIENFPGYWITDYGRVFSWRTKNPIVLTNSTDGMGYQHVRLFQPGSKRATLFKVHRLVATHFLTPDPDRKQVNHKDFNKQNNYYLNLEWVTPRENIIHSMINGKHARITLKSVKVVYNDNTEQTFTYVKECLKYLHICQATFNKIVEDVTHIEKLKKNNKHNLDNIKVIELIPYNNYTKGL